MINLTNHAKLRYVQRIVGVSDEREARQYLGQNEDKVSADLSAMMERAEMVWSGRIGNGKPSHYYMRDDIVLLVEEPGLALVTLFRSDFGFPPAINRQTIKSMLAEIRKLQQKAKRQEDSVIHKVSEFEVTLDNIDAQIQQVEAQLQLLQERRKNVETEMLVVKQEAFKTHADIASIATMLFNSIDFRKDLLAAKYTG